MAFPSLSQGLPIRTPGSIDPDEPPTLSSSSERLMSLHKELAIRTSRRSDDLSATPALPEASEEYSTRSDFDPATTFDETIIRIFSYDIDPDPAIRDLIHAAVEKLWSLQQLKADPDAAFASVSVHALISHISHEAVAKDFGDTIAKLALRAVECEIRMKYICQHNIRLKKRASAAMNNAISTYGAANITFKNFDELVQHFYTTISDNIDDSTLDQNTAANMAFDRNRHFQVKVITSLYYCGGLPKSMELHNFELGTDWSTFEAELRSITKKGAAIFGCPEGFNVTHGAWFCVLSDGSSEVKRITLREQGHYAYMLDYIVPSAVGTLEIFIIHDIMSRMPAAIEARARRYQEDPQYGMWEEATLRDAIGRPYPPIPVGFQMPIDDTVAADIPAAVEEAQDLDFLFEEYLTQERAEKAAGVEHAEIFHDFIKIPRPAAGEPKPAGYLPVSQRPAHIRNEQTRVNQVARKRENRRMRRRVQNTSE